MTGNKNLKKQPKKHLFNIYMSSLKIKPFVLNSHISSILTIVLYKIQIIQFTNFIQVLVQDKDIGNSKILYYSITWEAKYQSTSP